MRITRETLIRIAKETAQKRALADPDLVAAYLTGSLRSENPFLGNSTDIDIVIVHPGQPKIRREILALTPEIHLDIIHNPRSEYEKPKELRVHPWLGPELYDPLPLYGRQHFIEFIQAGVRAEYHEPVNVLARSRRNADHARQIWGGLQAGRDAGPARLLSFFKGIIHAANAIALLTGAPLAERRLLLQFQERAQAAGMPALADDLLHLLGGAQATPATLAGFLVDWENDFVEAAGQKTIPVPSETRDLPSIIAAPRLAYYKLAFEAMLAGESPQTILWPLMYTWTLAAALLSPTHQGKWLAACDTLGLAGESFNQPLAGLDHFLDATEEILDKRAVLQGI